MKNPRAVTLLGKNFHRVCFHALFHELSCWHRYLYDYLVFALSAGVLSFCCHLRCTTVCITLLGERTVAPTDSLWMQC